MEASALREWEHHNQIQCVDPKRDALFYHDAEKEKQVNAARPWANDPHYFKHTKISAVALIKMTMHARSGGELEIMGLMQGYTDGDTIVVTDAFRLPVEGTETRVNAQDEANEYIINFLDAARAHGRSENIVGWYHSHPGYGCWLSGIDVDTQILQQTYQDPSVAVVIDPDRTISSGKVEIGAFRTLTKVQGQPEAEQEMGAPAGGNGGSSSSAVPLAKVAEFGKHASRYYPLEVSHFKSTLDTRLLEDLWHKYWVQTLSQNPLVTNREYGNKQMLDLSSKIRETTVKLKGSMGMGQVMGPKAADAAYEKLAGDAKLVASKERSGLMAAEVKAKIFNDLRQDA